MECDNESLDAPQLPPGHADQDRYVDLVAEKPDGARFPIQVRAVLQSGLVSAALSNDAECKEVVLALAPAPMLALAVEWLAKADGKAPPEIKRPLQFKELEKSGVSAWECALLEPLTLRDCTSFIQVANYMEIKPLVLLVAAKIASFIKGKSVEECEALLKQTAEQQAGRLTSATPLPTVAAEPAFPPVVAVSGTMPMQS